MVISVASNILHHALSAHKSAQSRKVEVLELQITIALFTMPISIPILPPRRLSSLVNPVMTWTIGVTSDRPAKKSLRRYHQY